MGANEDRRALEALATAAPEWKPNDATIERAVRPVRRPAGLLHLALNILSGAKTGIDQPEPVQFP